MAKKWHYGRIATWIICFTHLIAYNTFSQASEDSHSLLWEITDDTTTEPSYLFGTIHLICQGDIYYPDLLVEKLNTSKALYLEIDMDDPGMMTAMAQHMPMKNNARLPDLLSEDDYKQVATFFKDSVGLNLSLFHHAKPFFLSSILFNRVLGCQPESYELKLMAMAQKDSKEIKGLETIEEQLAVFDSIPYHKQAEMLLYMIRNLPKAKVEFKELVEVYKSQDIEKLRKISQDSEFDFPNQEEILLNSRNRNWIPVISEQVKTQSTFFAMGAAHLGGEQGIIALLRKAGFTVRPLY